ncbi:MAG: hypothetical protein Ct9H300mP19_20130 [Dehalococcoidia bacterium]|nr:MAG: hypothetical protein Ct9H300mP19_20130 [Dehalococcoidia bacterium]
MPPYLCLISSINENMPNKQKLQNLSGRGHIVGVAESNKLGKVPEKSPLVHHSEAAINALDDAACSLLTLMHYLLLGGLLWMLPSILESIPVIRTVLPLAVHRLSFMLHTH